MNFGRAGAVALARALVAGCAGPVKQAEEFAQQGEWTKALQVYRAAQAEQPGNIEYRSRLRQMELKAAESFHQRGAVLAAQGDLDRPYSGFGSLPTA